ncbi:transcription antiterminator [Streptococcus sp. DD11]|uniref:BglG family transcription antiterminator n=1 Tax=Streptococcus sp. DD11 TaxID=1777879 RepID=UPI000B301794|nr:transcription antiterminator [Streptococcus sp. DD11]
MLLTKREEQLLKAFLNVGKLSMQDMKEILQVSSRTIYRTLSDLTASLERQEIQIHKLGRYYFLAGDIASLPTDLEVQTAYSQQERLIYITYLLLTTEGATTNESLQESLKVSNVTIIQDIADIEKRLLDFDLKIERQKGYKISGDPLRQRRLLAVLLTNAISVADFSAGNIGGYEILDPERIQLASQICTAFLTDFPDLDAKMKMFFAILLSLIGGEQHVDMLPNISKQALEISQNIFQDYSKQTAKFYSIQEIIYYASILDELIIKRQDNPLFTEKFDGEFFYNVSNLIDTVSMYTKIDFFRDKVLFKFLFHHIRLSLGIPILFPDEALPDSIQLLVERNKFLHAVVSLLVKDIFPKYLQHDYEYGLITLHFISSLGRSPEIYPIRILLLTDERRVTRDLLVTKIKSVAPFVEWIDVQSPADCPQIETDQYDYILSTKPLARQEVDIISSFPSVKELLELQEKLQQVRDNRTVVARDEVGREKTYDLQEYLIASSHLLSQFSLSALDNGDSFEKTAAQMVRLQENVLDQSYLTQKLLSHFQANPMAIPNTGLALLHTQSSKVTVSSFTIYELQRPIAAVSMKGEQESVTRCLLMLTPKDVSEEMRDLMTAISQSMIENHLYTEIYKTGNQAIIYQLLNAIFNEKIKKLED